MNNIFLCKHLKFLLSTDLKYFIGFYNDENFKILVAS